MSGSNKDFLASIGKSDEAKAFEERRRKADWVTKMATILSIVAWMIMIAVWVVIEFASPDTEMRFISSIFEAHHGTAASIRARWNYTLVYAAYILFIVSIAICGVAFVFDKLRKRRKTDKYKKSIFVIAGITIIAFVFFLLRFGYLIF